MKTEFYVYDKFIAVFYLAVLPFPLEWIHIDGKGYTVSRREFTLIKNGKADHICKITMVPHPTGEN